MLRVVASTSARIAASSSLLIGLGCIELGCATILGIDGEYKSQSSDAGSKPANRPQPADAPTAGNNVDAGEDPVLDDPSPNNEPSPAPEPEGDPEPEQGAGGSGPTGNGGSDNGASGNDNGASGATVGGANGEAGATGIGGNASASLCGNGLVEDSETCDDGNTDDRDGCSRECSDWFDHDFTRRTRFDLTNPTGVARASFPLLIVLDTSSIDWPALGNARPCFVDGDGMTVLAYEEDVWSEGARSLIWVNVPEIAAATDTIWMYYGNSNAEEPCEPSGSVWPESFRGVFHMNDATDSSVHAQAMTDTGTTDAAGAIGRARTVGEDQTLVGASDPTLRISGDLTISAWVSFASLESGTYRNSIVTYGDSSFTSPGNFQYGFYMTETTALFSYWAYSEDSTTVSVTSSATTDMPLQEFHHLAMVRDTTAGAMRFYYDGVELGSAQSYTAAPDGGEDAFLIIGGNPAGGSYAMTGMLDEVRIAAVAADAGHVQLEYLSMTGGIVQPVMDP